MPAPAPALPLVLALVGTDHHPFDRLVAWCLEVASRGKTRWFVQYGTSAWPTGLPDTVQGAPVLDVATLDRLLGESAAVVTHAGPGLVMEARLAGHNPVVVPRDPRLGEHIDRHQQRFVAHLLAHDPVLTAATATELDGHLQHLLGSPPPGPVPTQRRSDQSAATLAHFSDLVEATVLRRKGAGR